MTIAIIVAAGRGTRMGREQDKLFLKANHRPLIAHTWARFETAPMIDEIVLVVRADRASAFEKLAEQYRFQKPFELVAGGEERQDSVWNGLAAAPANTRIVAIHDGARPCVSNELIGACVKAASVHGASVAATRVSDTIKKAHPNHTIASTLDRGALWAVQTPQAFRLNLIQKAIETARSRGHLWTDDAAACEAIAQPVKLVESKWPNPKLTVPADLPYIEWLLTHRGGLNAR